MKAIKTRNGIAPALTKKQLELKAVPKKAYNFFKKVTPIRSGRARRSTVLQGNVIQANYPYAGALERGHSRQAPRGMFKPTLEYVRRLVRALFRR